MRNKAILRLAASVLGVVIFYAMTIGVKLQARVLFPIWRSLPICCQRRLYQIPMA